MMRNLFDRKIMGEANPDVYINENKNIRTQYDPESPNKTDEDRRREEKENKKKNFIYGLIIVICLIFFFIILF